LLLRWSTALSEFGFSVLVASHGVVACGFLFVSFTGRVTGCTGVAIFCNEESVYPAVATSVLPVFAVDPDWAGVASSFVLGAGGVAAEMRLK
jgi:hypothetical protein